MTEFRRRALERFAALLAKGHATMDDIRRANEDAGQHWFQPAAMRFFRSRVSDGVYGNGYFVSSERGPDMARRYTVRKALPDGSIDQVGEFQQYASRSGAHAAARKAAANNTPGSYELARQAKS